MLLFSVFVIWSHGVSRTEILCYCQCNFELSLSEFQIGAAELADINHLNGRGRSDRPPLDFERLLKNVPAHILSKILEIFHLDFVLFGYDKSPLLKIVEQKKRDSET